MKVQIIVKRYQGPEVFLKIDAELLNNQIRSMLDSNIKDPEKDGLHHLLGAIIDVCKEEEVIT